MDVLFGVDWILLGTKNIALNGCPHSKSPTAMRPSPNYFGHWFTCLEVDRKFAADMFDVECWITQNLLRRTVRQLHWLPVRYRIDYKLAVMTYKVRTTATPMYLSRHLTLRQPAQTLRSSDVPLLIKPFTRTEFAKRAFRHSAPTVWNSLPKSITNCDSLPVFKCRLKTYFFCLAFN